MPLMLKVAIKLVQACSDGSDLENASLDRCCLRRSHWMLWTMKRETTGLVMTGGVTEV